VTLALPYDPVFPHRDAVLDADFVASCLASRLDWANAITRSERVRATYRVGDSLRVLHRFHANGQTYNVAARSFQPGRSGRAFEKALANTQGGEAVGVVHRPDVDAVFWLFPHDRRVPALRKLEAVREALSTNLPRPWVHSRMVAWAPEHSATFQCLAANGAVLAYAKVGASAPIEYERYRALEAALADTRSSVLVPRAIAISSDRDIALIEAISGRRLEYRPMEMRAMGVALAHLHAASLSDLPRFERFTPSSRRKAVTLIVRAIPQLQPAVAALDARLTRVAPLHDALGSLHGDLHPRNAVVDGARLTLIDVEEMACGARAADLGSLLSRGICGRVVEDFTPAAMALASEALLEGYASVTALPNGDTLTWHTAAALLVERAQRAVARLNEPILRRLDALIAEANRLLGSLPGGR
jgi:Ser/Thr protein kinase RdoA (MazF antagonist)